MKDIIFNGYVLTSLVALFLSIIFIFEKKSVKIIIKLLIEVGLIYAVFKCMYLDYNFVILTFFISLIITTINSILDLGFKKILITSIITQILENILLFITCFVIINLKRKEGMFEELNDINFKFVLTVIAFVSIIVNYKLNYLILRKMDEIKVKTEDVEFKKIFSQVINIGKEYLETEVVLVAIIYFGILILSKVFISNLYFDNNLINEMVCEIAIVTCLGMIVNVFSIVICSYMYSCINRRKESYKISSENRINGEKRTLKI